MTCGASLGRALEAWVAAVGRSWVWVLSAAAILTVGAGVYAARHLGVQTDIIEMFAADLPFRKTDTDYRARFPHENDTLLLVIDGPAPELSARAARRLADALANDTDRFEDVYQPHRSRFLEEHALLFLDIDELEDLTDRLANAQPFLGRLSRDRTLRGFSELLTDALEPADAPDWTPDLVPVLDRTSEAVAATMQGRPHALSWQTLIDGDVLSGEQRPEIIIVKPRLDYGSLRSSGSAIEHIRERARSLRIDADRGLGLRVTGSVALRHEELETMRRGAALATTLAFVLVSLVLLVALRSIRLVVVSLITLIIGLVWTAAFAALAIGHLNLISIAFGVLYIGLGIDFAIHLCLRYQELVAREDRATAIETAAGDVGVSIALCAVTTSIAFYAFVPTSFQGVSELGLIAGTGMLISLIVTLTVLPALLSRAGPTTCRTTAVLQVRWLLDLPDRHAVAIRVVTVIAVVAALPVLTRIAFDLDPLHLRDPETESVATLNELLEDAATSPWHIVVLETDRESLAETQRRLEDLEEVRSVVALPDFVPTDQAEKLALIDDLSLMLGTEWSGSEEQASVTAHERLDALAALTAVLEPARGRAPQLAASAARLSATLHAFTARIEGSDDGGRTLERLERALLGAFPATLEQLESAMQARPIRLDTVPDELRRQWLSDDGVFRLAVFPASTMSDPEALRAFVAAVRTVRTDAAGAPVFHVAAADAVIDAFTRALALAFIAIGVLLLLVMRSLRDTALVLVPVLLAGVLLAATATLLGIPFNFANVIAIPLLLGMGVDSGIHMILRCRAAQPPTNVLATSTSRAVLYSNLTTVAGFGALAVSTHPGMASLGQLLTLGIAFVLIGALLVLPALPGIGDIEGSTLR